MFDKGDGVVGEDIGHIAARFDALFAGPQLVGIVVAVDEAILPEAKELIESAVLGVVFHVTAEVPFSHAGRAVAFALKYLAESDLIGVEHVPSQIRVHCAGALVVASRHQRRARG